MSSQCLQVKFQFHGFGSYENPNSSSFTHYVVASSPGFTPRSKKVVVPVSRGREQHQLLRFVHGKTMFPEAFHLGASAALLVEDLPALVN